MKNIEDKLEIKRLNNIANSFLYFCSGIILFSLIFFIILNFFNIINYWTILIFIIIYYLNVLRINKINSLLIKSIFINFLSLIALYNILLNFNNFIFDMIELSDNYLISNITYFYISFLITTFNYKFYNKLNYINDVFFGLFINNKILSILLLILLCGFMIITIIILTMVIISLNQEILDKIIFFSIMLLFLLIITIILYSVKVYLFDYNINKTYEDFKKFIFKIENCLNIITIWIIEIFKIEKINTGCVINSKGNFNIINSFVLILSKFFPIFYLLFLNATNTYYITYSFTNNDYCKVLFDDENKNNLLDKKSKIIELNNNNILIGNGKNKIIEIKCQKEKINIEMKNNII